MHLTHRFHASPYYYTFSVLLLFVSIVVSPAAFSTVVINEFMAATSDRLLQWDDSGVSRLGSGTAWYENSFDDTHWVSAPGPLGYGVAGLGTDIDFRHEARSLYVRRTFNVSSAQAQSNANLILDIDYDDGFVAFLNGREIMRKSLGGANMWVYHDQPAYNQRMAGTTDTFEIGIASAYLQPGENVLAIQVHNWDIEFWKVPIAQDTFKISAALRINGLGSLVEPGDSWRYFIGHHEPSGGVANEEGQFVDWIELHNTGNTAVNMQNWSLTDNANNPRKWVFPSVTIEPNGYLVVLADGNPSDTPPLQTNFSLSGEGEFLGLLDPSETPVSIITPVYPPQDYFHSYGRTDNETYAYFSHATPGKPNSGPTYQGILEPPVLSLESGLYDGAIQLSMVGPPGAVIRYNMHTPMTALGANGIRWEFDRDGNTEGWGVQNHTTNMSVSDGALHFEVTGNDPYIGGPSIMLDAAQNPYVTIRMRQSMAGLNEIFWSTLETNHMTAAKAQTFQVSTTNEYREYVIDLRDHPEWRGTITRLRFDPPNGIPSGSVSIDYIRILSEPDVEPAPPVVPGSQPVPGRAPTDTIGTAYTGPITIDQNTVIRASSFREGYIASSSTDRSYLFNTGLPGNSRPALESIPVISLIGDEERSMTEPHGFMAIIGGAYDGQHGWWNPKDIDHYNNMIMHGRAFERPVTIEYFDPATGDAFNYAAGIRGARSDVGRPGFRRDDGPWLAGNTKWSFRLYFRNSYSVDTLRHNLLPSQYSSNRFRVMAFRSNGGDWQNPFINDELTRRLQIYMGSEGSWGTFVNVFINGQYKAYLNLCERLDEDFFKNTYGSDNDWDIVKMQVNRYFEPILELSSGTYDAWNELIQYASQNNLQDYHHYLEVSRRVDLPQFIDWILANTYPGNQDWAWNNWVAARERVSGAKFRFYVWDADYTFHMVQGLGSFQHQTLNGIQNGGEDIKVLYRALKNSPEFRLLFLDRVQKHFYNDGVLTEASVAGIVQELREKIEPSINHVFNQQFATYIPNEWIPVRTQWLVNNHFPEHGYTSPLLAPSPTVQQDSIALHNPNAQGMIYYTLDGSDPRKPAVADTHTLVGESAAKRVLVPESDIGTAWRTDLGFNDASWIAGTGGVGYERSSGYEPYIGIDVENLMYGGHHTCYIRIPFSATANDLAQFDSIYLNMRYDDGFVAYLNGVEVARRNFIGTPAWDSHATALVAKVTALEAIDISNFKHLVQAGQNLLAIHGMNYYHSDSLFSGDLLFSTSLTLQDDGPASLNPAAQPYSSTLPVLAGKIMLKARVFNEANDAWSPLLDYAIQGDAQDFSMLKISEIMYNPLSGLLEFIELYNAGDVALNLSGVAFVDGIYFTFPGNTILQPGEYVVLVESLSEFQAAYPGIPVAGVYTGKLSNSGERLTLADANGDPIQSFTYDNSLPWPLAANGFGFSLVLQDYLADPGNPSNWRASAAIGGSPGAADPAVTIPAVLVNEALPHTDIPVVDTVEIYNPTNQTADIRGWFLTDRRLDPYRARVPFDLKYIIPPGGYAVLDEHDFAENPGEYQGSPLGGFRLSSMGEDIYIYSADTTGNLTGYVHGHSFGASFNGVSFGRHVSSDGVVHFVPQIENTFGGPNAGPLVGPVVISEIHYHPVGDDDEYLVLTNITDMPVNLWDESEPPRGNPENTWRVRGIGYQIPVNTTIEAQGRLVIANTDPDSFRIKYRVPGNVQVLGPFGNRTLDGDSTLSKSGETITLLRPDQPNIDENTGEESLPEVLADQISYDDRAPWPREADGDGMALRRIDHHEFGNDPANWHAALPSFPLRSEHDQPHSADVAADYRIGLSELLRVVQFYNQAGYHCAQFATEDGFMPGPGSDHNCLPHDSDYAPQNWKIELREVLRLVQLHNAMAYAVCLDTEDGFCIEIE